MGNSVIGSLILKLTAHTAEFDSNLNKAGQTARGFADNVTTHTEQAVGKMERLGKGLASRLFGGGNVKLAGAFGDVVPLLSSTAVKIGGVATSLVLAAIHANKLGGELRNAHHEAVVLGISYNELMNKGGFSPLSGNAQLGMMQFSQAIDTVGVGLEKVKTLWNEIVGAFALGITGGVPMGKTADEWLKLGDAADRRKLRDEGQRAAPAVEGGWFTSAVPAKEEIMGFNQFMEGLRNVNKDMDLSEMDLQLREINKRWDDLNDKQKQNLRFQLEANQWKKEGIELDKRIADINRAINTQAMIHAGKGAEESKLLNRPGFDKTSDRGKAELDAVRRQDSQTRKFAEEEQLRTEQGRLAERVKSLADSLTIVDPIVNFRNNMELLNDGLRKGAITQEQFAGAVAGLRDKTVKDLAKDLQPGNLAGAYEVGTLQAYQQRLAMEKNAQVTRQTELLQQQLQKEEESLTVQREIRDNIKTQGVATL